MYHRIVYDDRRVTPHFRGREFRCRCCGRIVAAVELCEALEVLRGKLGGVPVKVTSGYRCPPRNAAVGGAGRSWHTLGLAADIAAPPLDAGHVGRAAEALRLIGLLSYVRTYRNDGFVHVDVRPA